jgi:hypothetical protein
MAGVAGEGSVWFPPFRCSCVTANRCPEAAARVASDSSQFGSKLVGKEAFFRSDACQQRYQQKSRGDNAEPFPGVRLLRWTTDPPPNTQLLRAKSSRPSPYHFAGRYCRNSR